MIMNFLSTYATERSRKSSIDFILSTLRENSLPTKNFEMRYMPEVGLPMLNAIFQNPVVQQIDWPETI